MSKKHPLLDNYKNQIKLCLAMCSFALSLFTTHPNVCNYISNQGPLPLVRGGNGEYPWEKRERGAFHSKQMQMLKDNIEDRFIDGDDTSPPGHPASYSPGYQRLQKKPKVASYITLRPYTMLQAILLSLFGVGILSVKILSPVQRLLITKLPRCQKVSTPSPLGSRQGSPTPTNDFVSHHSSAPTTFLSTLSWNNARERGNIKTRNMQL